MKRNHYLAAIVLPLAGIAGWWNAPSAASNKLAAWGDGKTTQVQQADPGPPPAKSAERSTRDKRPLAPPLTWKDLRQYAATPTAELQAKLVELVNSQSNEIFGGRQGWLLEHLFQLDPQGTLSQVRDHCRDYQFGNVARYCCGQDPERAVTLLLFGKEFAEESRDPFGFSCPVDFRGFGARDPEKGLKMILDLPPGKPVGAFVTSLLEGIALSEPKQVGAYFDRIVAATKLPESQLGQLLSALGSADPAQAVAWAEKHYEGKIPESVAAKMVEGMARNDVQAALKLYEGMRTAPDDTRRQAAFWLSNAMVGQGLDASWSWIEANAPGACVEELKGNAWSAWAWRNGDEAVERILAEPALLLGGRGPEMLNLLQNQGREKEVFAMLEKLSAAEQEKLRPVLAANGMLSEEAAAGAAASSEEWMLRLERVAAGGGKPMEALPEEHRETVAARLRDGERISYLDPRLELEIMGSTPQGVTGQGAQISLARFALLDSAAAVQMVEAMPPGEARTQAVKTVAMNWSVDDRSAATAWQEKMSAGP